MLAVNSNAQKVISHFNFDNSATMKKLNPEFIKELESTAKSDPFTKDEFGEYRFGTFLHGCAIVKVEY